MLPHPPYVTRTNTKTVPWTMTVLAPREKMNCAIAVTLEFMQQRQTKEEELCRHSHFGINATKANKRTEDI